MNMIATLFIVYLYIIYTFSEVQSYRLRLSV